MVRDIVAALLLLAGGLTVALAALGVARLPEALMRMHAATKAGALGAGLLLLGAGIALGGFSTLFAAVLGIVFLYATSPLAAHVLGRAAFIEAERREGGVGVISRPPDFRPGAPEPRAADEAPAASPTEAGDRAPPA